MVKRKGSVQVAFQLPVELAERLRTLSERTRVSQAAYFREAIEALLKDYEDAQRSAKSKRSK